MTCCVYLGGSQKKPGDRRRCTKLEVPKCLLWGSTLGFTWGDGSIILKAEED